MSKPKKRNRLPYNAAVRNVMLGISLEADFCDLFARASPSAECAS